MELVPCFIPSPPDKPNLANNLRLVIFIFPSNLNLIATWGWRLYILCQKFFYIFLLGRVFVRWRKCCWLFKYALYVSAWKLRLLFYWFIGLMLNCSFVSYCSCCSITMIFWCRWYNSLSSPLHVCVKSNFLSKEGSQVDWLYQEEAPISPWFCVLKQSFFFMKTSTLWNSRDNYWPLQFLVALSF